MTSLLQDLSRLSNLSSELEKTKVERKVKADTKKNRQALLKACNEQNLDELRRLIDLGVPLNFAEDPDSVGPRWRTALGICARENWTPGILALLGAGANEAEIEGYFDNNRNEPALAIAACQGNLAAFGALFGAYDEARQKKAIFLIRHPALLAPIEAHGKSALIDDKKMGEMLAACIPHLDPGNGSEPLSASACSVFETLAARMDLRGERGAKLREALWAQAILSNAGAGALQGLAQRGVEPPSDGHVEITPAGTLSHNLCFERWLTITPDPRSWDPGNTRIAFSDQAKEPTRVPMAALALARGNGEKDGAAYALCAIPALRSQLTASEWGRFVLARKPDPAIHRRLASLGEDLSTFRDEEGSTALHRAIASHQNKATIEALARACVEWLGMRDAKGRMPVELLNGRHADLAVIFDQIGMRDGLKGRRGKRPTPQTQRRL